MGCDLHTGDAPNGDIYDELFRIAEQLRSGEETNWQQFIELLTRVLCGWLRNHLPPKLQPWLEDILQEVMVKRLIEIRRNRKKWKNAEHFKNWLYVTALTTIADYIREMCLSGVPATTPDVLMLAPEELSRNTWGFHFVWVCVDSLPPATRAVFFLREFGGFGYREIEQLLADLIHKADDASVMGWGLDPKEIEMLRKMLKGERGDKAAAALKQLVYRTKTLIAKCLVSRAVERVHELASPVTIGCLEHGLPGYLSATVTVPAGTLNELWCAAHILAHGLEAGFKPVLSTQSQQCIGTALSGSSSEDAYETVTRGLLFLAGTPCVRFPRRWQFVGPPEGELQIGGECLLEIALQRGQAAAC